MEAPPPEDHSFTPPNHKLITVYLRRRVAGEPLPSAGAAYFHDVDIYAAEPATLTAGLQPVPSSNGDASSWLFFTPVKTKSSTDSRRSRRVGDGVGTWHSEHAPEVVIDDEGNRVGHRQLFSYKDMGRRRTGWSMWEFGGADQEGGEKLMVLCKIHQGHACSRRADGSAARSSTRKRKGMDDVGNKASAPTKRRLFAPPAQMQPAASEGKISATLETIPSSRDETEPSEDKIGATLDAIHSFWGETDPLKDTLSSVCSSLAIPDASQIHITSAAMESPAIDSFLIPDSEAIPSSRSEAEASKDTPRSVLSFWNEPYLLQRDRISAALRSLGTFSPEPLDATQKHTISTTMGCPATESFSIPELEVIPDSRIEIEETLMSVLNFCDGTYPLQQDKTSATLRSLDSFSPKPDASQEIVISTTMDCPAKECFLIPEQEVIPDSSTETEDRPRSVLSFWNETYPLQQDKTSATMRSPGSFSPKPDASQEDVISTIMESPESFLISEPQGSPGEMVTLDSVFVMDGGAPPSVEYCNNGNSADSNSDNVSRVPLLAPGAEIMPCSVGNVFEGDFSTYGESDAGASSSWTGYDMAASYSDGKDFFSGMYGCGVPLLPSTVPSHWFSSLA
ncbi:hypothetical protein QOZ80_2BG0184600 [Eleusine coracana subsp. coracana]|nr:hypothetical protein QOZ80_2BG0184600 [Eleusine coracana subsp. coracana]